MFRPQNGLVVPMEVPLPIGPSWVTKFQTDVKKRTPLDCNKTCY